MRTHLLLGLILFLCFNCTQGDNALGTPVLIAPIDGSTIIQNPPTLIWQRVENTAGYDLVAADDIFFGDSGIVAEVLCLNDTSYTLDSALNTGTYYWMVRALEGG